MAKKIVGIEKEGGYVEVFFPETVYRDTYFMYVPYLHKA